MKLENKKLLAAKSLEVGVNRIRFNSERLAEIKEAITKQDIRDLFASGAIIIKEIKGRRAIVRRKRRRGPGHIKKPIRNAKRDYITLTRKLRSLIADLRRKETIKDELYWKIRKEIRAHIFKSKAQLKERISAEGAKKW